MNKLFGVFYLVIILSIGVFAQEKGKDNKAQERPNFSGNWVIDKEKSFSNSEERKSVANYTLVITHSGEEIKIFRNYTIKNNKSFYSEILYTDKRKETNVDKTGLTMQPEMKSETFWKKQTVVRHFLYDRTSRQMPVYIMSNEKYSLSKDGKVLTITTEYDFSSTSSPAAQAAIQRNGVSSLKRELIFNKQE